MKLASMLIPLLLGGAFIAAIFGVTINPRADIGTLLTWYVAAFVLYSICISQKQYWRWWVGMGIAARAILIFIFPNLSDDLYRFFWDGNLILSGINPFGVLPTDIVDSGQLLPPEMLNAYGMMNSPQYHTVYPVTLQGLFALASWISGTEIASFSIALKFIFLCFECGTLWLLYHLLRDRGRVHDITFYALNPLVIVELSGNLHGEAIMIFLMLLTYRLLLKEKVLASASLLSLAISTKLIPVLCLPFLARRLTSIQFVLFTVATSGMTIILFVPVLFSSELTGFFTSLDLYFRKFEFNASVYYLGRWVGYQLEGFNTIASTGPIFAMLSVCAMGVYGLLERKPKLENLPVAIIAVLSIYYAFATTVHPWYLCPLIAFCTLTVFRYPIVWSAMVFLSYSAYRSDPTEEALWLIVLEYVIVIGWLMIEVTRARRIKTAGLKKSGQRIVSGRYIIHVRKIQINKSKGHAPN